MVFDQSIIILHKFLLQFVCLCVLVIACQPSCTAGPGDWWLFHHDLLHTGRSPFTGLASSSQKWAFATHDAIGHSSLVLATGGTIYLGSFDRNLYAVNLDGTQPWAFLSGSVIQSSPAIRTDGTNFNKLSIDCIA